MRERADPFLQEMEKNNNIRAAGKKGLNKNMSGLWVAKNKSKIVRSKASRKEVHYAITKNRRSQ